MISVIVTVLFALGLSSCNSSTENKTNKNESQQMDDYRPAYHFSPKKGWMNDPNGLVFLDDEYHLFFQYNPDTTVWGPMHWGHATSKDLIHWEEKEIALFPDSLGTIFSGSAVVDKENTAGFGANALVALFTHHNHAMEHEKTGLHQYQSLAYSLDKGTTWTKYEGNPVLPNPGIWDFRDPKVFWHQKSKRWVMVLATKQSITFYSSPNLKEWTRTGEFGQGVGAHGGVWECPDLLEFNTKEGPKWVLLVSINPGGPNTGSATQYFVGEFDGQNFTSTQKDTRWMDYGPDNYAGVTFSNIPNRHILMGWMSNWEYANVVPASTWRSGMTIAKELSLEQADGKWILASKPVEELQKFTTPLSEDVSRIKEDTLTVGSQFKLNFETERIEDFEFTLQNSLGEHLVFGFDKTKNEYYLDRSRTGKVDFSDKFITRAKAPRTAHVSASNYTVLIDRNSIEIFADNGLTNLTGLFFLTDNLNKIHLQTKMQVSKLNVYTVSGPIGY